MPEYNRENPILPEGINISKENPLKEFFILVLGAMLAVVLTVVVLSVAAKQLAPFIPFSWEEKVIQGWDIIPAEFSGNGAGVDASVAEQKQQVLQQLVDNISAHANLPDGMKITAHYLPGDTVNAFASLGGNVFVFQGLIDSVGSENALSMVLAHEIAHVKYRHPIQAMSRGIIFQIVMTALLGTGQDLQMLMGQTGMMTLLNFNRAMETQADRDGLVSLKATYGHTQGADSFFTKMLADHGASRWTTFMESHPHLEDRLAMIRASQMGQHELRPMPAILLKSNADKASATASPESNKAAQQ